MIQAVKKLRWDLRKQSKGFSNLATRYGQFRSIRQWSCLDGDGRPIPWYTYPAIEYLSHIDFSALKVLEYGSGNSTIWWATRCTRLTSVENNLEWHTKIQAEVGGLKNVTYLLEPDEQRYVQQCGVSDADIVIIDGEHRAQCADWFMSCDRHTVMLIFDNADWYPKTIAKLQSLGWVQVDFHGFGPINEYTWTTSIFLNPSRRGEIQYGRPLRSVCAINANGVS
jgi:hypothetical protein